MAKYSRTAYFIVLLALVVNLMVERGEALTCGDLGASMEQCGPYATGATSQPSYGCCSAVKGVYAMAKTTQDRRSLCNCIKQSSSSVHGVQLSNVAAIPLRCGLRITIPTNPNFNCDTIN